MTAREHVAQAVIDALAAVAAGARPRDLESAVLDVKEDEAPAANGRDPLKAGPWTWPRPWHAWPTAAVEQSSWGSMTTSLGLRRPFGLPPGLDAEDLRHRIWQLTAPSLVVGAEPKKAGGVDLLVLTAEPGFDLHRVAGRLRERIADHCEPTTS